MERKFLTIKEKAPSNPPNVTVVHPPEIWIPSPQTDTESDTDYETEEEPLIYLTSITRTESFQQIDNPVSPITGPRINREDNQEHPLQQLQQHRPLRKGDRVTFLNEITNTWTIVQLASGPNKYYRKHGPYHNFQDSNGAKGGH